MSSAHLPLERAVRGSALALTEITLKVLVRNELGAMSAESLTEPINFRMSRLHGSYPETALWEV